MKAAEDGWRASVGEVAVWWWTMAVGDGGDGVGGCGAELQSSRLPAAARPHCLARACCA